MGEPPVSIVMRSFNEGWALRDTLPALQAQDYPNWELIVIDSGSTDGSVELIRAARPKHFIQIAPPEYNPARVMNHGMQLAGYEFGIFLNADATPQTSHWLGPLVKALQDPRVAARVLDLRAGWERGPVSARLLVTNALNYMYNFVPRTLEPVRTMSVVATWTY